MADVFEKEGSPTQDATYREHLDRNWEAGNKKFAELEEKFQDAQKQYSGIFEVNQNNAEDTKQNVAALAEDTKQNVATLKEIQKQVAKLNLAVFGDGAIPIDDPVYQDNHDKRAQEVHLD